MMNGDANIRNGQQKWPRAWLAQNFHHPQKCSLPGMRRDGFHYQNGGKPQSAFEQKKKYSWYAPPSSLMRPARLGLMPHSALRPPCSVIEP